MLIRIPFRDDCSTCGRCGLSADGRSLEVWAEGGPEARPGDEVEVLIPREDRLRAALLLFGLPLAGLLAGAAAGALAGGETAEIAGAGAGLAAGFAAGRLLQRRRKSEGRTGIRVAGPSRYR